MRRIISSNVSNSVASWRGTLDQLFAVFTPPVYSPKRHVTRVFAENCAG